MNPAIYSDLGHGITCIDTQYVRDGLASCYLIEHNGTAAFIDTGTNSTTPLLLSLLEQKGLSREQVKYVIPTHIHLDHAGGAGTLMAALPQAQLVIHPRGARHMIDPTKLQAGAMAVYGEEAFKTLYGTLEPIDENRVMIATDGMSLNLNGRELICLDTPGHAKHHICIIDPASKGMFTGDTFGVAYPELASDTERYIFPPSSPIDFDPEAWLTSVDRLVQTGSQRAYLTHFCDVDQIDDMAQQLSAQIQQFADYATSATSTEDLTQKIRSHFITSAQAINPDLSTQKILDVLSLDLDIIVQGLEVWIDKHANIN